MPTRKSPAKSSKPTAKSGKTTADSASTIYKDFEVWNSSKRPSWHPIKRMRYVFFRMIAGVTISDAIREIHWSAAEFWHLIDLERHDPFRVEYGRAKKLQARAFADSVVEIAEGRDATSKRSLRAMRKMVERGLRKAGRQKSTIALKAIVENLLAQFSENDTRILARNKLQIDAAKWIAKNMNPGEYSESSRVAIGGVADSASGDARPITIAFVGPDGQAVIP